MDVKTTEVTEAGCKRLCKQLMKSSECCNGRPVAEVVMAFSLALASIVMTKFSGAENDSERERVRDSDGQWEMAISALAAAQDKYLEIAKKTDSRRN